MRLLKAKLRLEDTASLTQPAAVAECRNCGRSDTTETLLNGTLAPFFERRVFGTEPAPASPALRGMVHAGASSGIFTLGVIRTGIGLLGAVGAVSRARQGIRPQSAGRVQITVCRACQFVGPGFDVPESGLHRLYQDYRSAGYNEERSLYEPFYSVIAPYVGDNPVEQRERDDNLSRFLSDAIDPASISSVLDYGGDSGSHIPKVLQHCQKTVFDISDAEPVAGVTKETEVERLGTYDFIQICHTLEHVVGPRSLTAAALDHLAPGGYIYIEVPQDKTEADVQRLREAAAPTPFTIHEHINLYTPVAVASLIESLGLKLLSLRVAQLDFGWTRQSVISALAAKPAA